MLKTLQEGGAYNRELVMSGARNREVLCVLEGEGTAGGTRVKVNRPKFWHESGSVCVSKSETESTTERKKEMLRLKPRKWLHMSCRLLQV